MLPEKNLGEFIRDKRLEKKISLRKFAELIGVNSSFLSRLESNQQTGISEERLKMIATELGLDIDVLLAKAGKIASDAQQAFFQNPTKYAEMLRRQAPKTKETQN